MNKLSMGNRAKTSNRRVLGLGDSGQQVDTSSVMALMKTATRCAPYALDTVAKQELYFDGPMTNLNTLALFTDSWSVLSAGQNPPGVADSYATPGLINGVFQPNFLACAIGVHLNASPYCFAARGNAFGILGTPGTQAFSPDTWTGVDSVLTTGAWGAGVVPPQAYADLAYGEPALEAFWGMVRGYNLRWTYGSQINILDEQLRDVAYMPPNAQEGTGSSSEYAILRAVAEVNANYANIGSTQIFQMIDTLRVGSQTASGTGVFLGNRDFEFEGVTYGGSDLRSKIGIGNNSEFRSLTNPQILRGGQPIGMFFEAKNPALVKYFRNQFDATQGLGGTVPANLTQATQLAAGATSAYLERTIDGSSRTQTQLAQRAYFKGFRATISQEIKGWEMSESLYDVLKNNAALAAQVCSECGCQAGWM